MFDLDLDLRAPSQEAAAKYFRKKNPVSAGVREILNNYNIF